MPLISMQALELYLFEKVCTYRMHSKPVLETYDSYDLLVTFRCSLWSKASILDRHNGQLYTVVKKRGVLGGGVAP